MNEIVEHNNNMNSVALRKFNAVELDLFMTLCHKMKHKSVDVITFSFSELKELCGFTSTDMHDFVTTLDSTYNKLIQTNIKVGNDMKWTRFVLFTKYTIDTLNQEITIGVNKEFQYILNNLSSEFTRFELQEFIELKSSYAKECYRRLKQFRTTGIWKVKIDEFRRVLDIPDSYRMGNIDQKVLKPIREELTPLFKNFKITKVKKKGRGRGGVVDRIEFTFDKETIDNNHKTQSQSQMKPTNFICKQCGKQLYETVLNGSNCWCHNFKVQGDNCKAIFNSIADIKGIDEKPNRDKYEQYAIEQETYSEMPEETKQKLREILGDDWDKNYK